MTQKPLSRFPVPELDDLPEDIRNQLLAVQTQTGFIPNVFVVLAHRPAEFRAFMAYYTALMEKNEGLTKAEREMIVVATSAANSCPYCVVAHGAVLRIRSRDPYLADQLTVNYRQADITDRQRLMLEFALMVSQDSEAIEDEDFEELKDSGFSDDEIWDIGAIAAFFALSNRMASLTGMWPNDEFYSMGRTTPNPQNQPASQTVAATSPKRPMPKAATAKKSAAKKGAVKKSVAKKSVAKKGAAKKGVAKKSVAKKRRVGA